MLCEATSGVEHHGGPLAVDSAAPSVQHVHAPVGFAQLFVSLARKPCGFSKRQPTRLCAVLPCACWGVWVRTLVAVHHASHERRCVPGALHSGPAPFSPRSSCSAQAPSTFFVSDASDKGADVVDQALVIGDVLRRTVYNQTYCQIARVSPIAIVRTSDVVFAYAANRSNTVKPH